MTDDITLQLSEQVGICTGGVCSILQPYYQQSIIGKDIAIFEGYGFLLAYLCVKGGIDLHEAGNCIACLVGVTLEGDKNSFISIAKALDFHLKVLVKIEKNPQDDFFNWSIIIYNLLHPNKHDDFSAGIPIGEMNALEVMTIFVELDAFLKEVLPQKINPILEKA
ncbi:MAG: hypothetical protein ACI30X_07010 [Muribaculaceae bacterium]